MRKESNFDLEFTELESLSLEIAPKVTATVKVATTKVITTCARAERWCNEDIKTQRRDAGWVTKRRRGGGEQQHWQDEVKEPKKALKRAIKKATKEYWEDILNRAEGEEV